MRLMCLHPLVRIRHHVLKSRNFASYDYSELSVFPEMEDALGYERQGKYNQSIAVLKRFCLHRLHRINRSQGKVSHLHSYPFFVLRIL